MTTFARMQLPPAVNLGLTDVDKTLHTDTRKNLSSADFENHV
jgi:hypothetical protein